MSKDIRAPHSPASPGLLPRGTGLLRRAVSRMVRAVAGTYCALTRLLERIDQHGDWSGP